MGYRFPGRTQLGSAYRWTEPELVVLKQGPIQMLVLAWIGKKMALCNSPITEDIKPVLSKLRSTCVTLYSLLSMASSIKFARH